MDKLIIRKCEEKDLPDIAEIHIQTWRKAYRGIVDDVILDNLNTERSFQNFNRVLNDPDEFFYVAEYADKTVGFMTFSLKSRSDVFFCFAEISCIYILPDFQGKGIGKRLMSHAFKVIRDNGISKIMLWALKDNYQKLFYQSCGGKIFSEKDHPIKGKSYRVESWVWENITLYEI